MTMTTAADDALTEANAALGFLVREARSNLARDGASTASMDVYANRVERALGERYALQQRLKGETQRADRLVDLLREARSALDRQTERVHEANEALDDERETLREIDRIRQSQATMLEAIAQELVSSRSSQIKLLYIQRIMEGTKK